MVIVVVDIVMHRDRHCTTLDVGSMVSGVVDIIIEVAVSDSGECVVNAN
jgi:hypothetical protein